MITLQGDSFGTAPQVWMAHIVGDQTPLAPAKQLKVLSFSGTSATALIPGNETTGVYAIFVEDGGGTPSAPAMVNVARALGAHDLCGTSVNTNGYFRLFGRNLCIGSAVPTVTFYDGTNAIPASVSTVPGANDNNTLQVMAPGLGSGTSGITVGQSYTVQVNNGYGGTNGTTSMPYPVTARALGTTTNSFGLSVPWGNDFVTNQYNVTNSPYLADPTGVTNAFSAIQAAITAAHAHGGEVVFPPGQYLVDYSTNSRDCIGLASKVVLVGQGTPPPVINLAAVPTTTNYYGVIAANIANTGIYNLDIEEPDPNSALWEGVALTGCSNVFLSHVKISTPGGTTLQTGSNHSLAIQNSTIENTWTAPVTNSAILTNNPSGQSVHMGGNTDLMFSGNAISYYFARVTFEYGERSLLETNHISRNAYPATTNQNSGGLEMSLSENTVVLNNTIDKGPAGGSSPLPQDGDGETILVQGGGATYQDFGYVTSASATSISDSSKNWTNNYSIPDTSTDNGQLYYVAIVGGKGAGQCLRMSSTNPNTTTTVNLCTNWMVNPDATSRYSIFHAEGNHQLIKGNTLTNNVQGIEYYSTSLRDVTVTGNILQDNGGIFLDSDYRPPTNRVGGQFSVNMDSQVFNNTITNTASDPYKGNNCYAKLYVQTDCTTNYTPGTAVYDVEVRNNTVSAPSLTASTNGEGYGTINTGRTDNAVTNLLGVVFQGNTAANTTNAYHLSTGAYNTAIWNGAYTNVANVTSDATNSGMTHASVSTIYGALTGLWTFDGTCADSSGNAQTGTGYGSPVFTNDVAFTSPPDADALALFGTNRVEVPNAPLINPNNEMTIVFWVKGTANGTRAYQRILCKDMDTNAPGWEIQQSSTNADLNMRIDTSAASNQIKGTVTGALDGAWHQVAYVVSHGTVQAYFNGTAVGSAQTYTEGGGFGNDAINLGIGAVPSVGTHAFTGEIDEVQIYQAALTAAEISALHYH